jgi:hypothetical protein
MDGRHGNATLEAGGKPLPSKLRPWLGALGYLAAHALLSLLGISWGPLGRGWAGQGLMMMASLAALVVAGYLPRHFEHRRLQSFLLPLGWLIVAGAVTVALHEPYVIVRESQWLGPGSYRATLHPFFTLGLHVLLFLAALGHTVPFSSRRGRLLFMDAPLLAFVALCLVLHLGGYPAFEG